MKIIFAKHLGFCSGVKRAVDIAEKAVKEDPKPIQFLGSLVHNEEVIKKFQKKKVRFIKSQKGAKPGTLIIQAHGIPPLPKNLNKEILIRDATCPLVKKVQLISQDLYKGGYQVIIVGDKNHSETKGIKGYTEKTALIIQNKSQLKQLTPGKKIGVVAQTTQTPERLKDIVKALKSKEKEVKCFNTICPEVIARQKEVDNILKQAEGILVIGSRTSANTRRLVEKARAHKKRVWWVNSAKELKKGELRNLSSLGVISGTSTPDWIIQEIIKQLNTFQ